MPDNPYEECLSYQVPTLQDVVNIGNTVGLSSSPSRVRDPGTPDPSLPFFPDPDSYFLGDFATRPGCDVAGLIINLNWYLPQSNQTVFICNTSHVS